MLADAPLLDRPGLEDPVNMAPPIGGAGPRRLLARPLLFPLSIDGARLTLSTRIRHVAGRIWSWPADDPWLLLDRQPDGALTLTAGPDVLRVDPVDAPPSARWQTLAAALDGPAGRITLLVDGRPVAALERAPFGLPRGDDLQVGPAVGDAADLAAWPDRLGDDRLLDHHLSASGRRPPPIAPRIELTVRSGRGGVRLGCPRFAPDGRWLAGCHSGALVLLDRATGAPTGWLLEHVEPITGVDIDPTGRFVATADGSRTVLVWRVATRAVDTRIDLSHGITGVRFSPDGRWLAGWTGPGARGAPGLAFVPFHAPTAAPRVIPLPAPARIGAWAPRGPTLALGFDRHPPHRARPDGPLTALQTPPATALAWHPTRPVLFVGTADGAVVRVDGQAATTVRPAPPGPTRAPALDRLPRFFDRDHPAAGERFIWPGWAAVGSPAWQPPADRRTITDLAVDARHIALADDQGATLLSHEPGAAPPHFVPHAAPVTAVALVDDILLTGGADGAVRRFAATDGRPLGETADRRAHPDGFPAPVRWLIPAPDGAVIAASRLGDWYTELIPVRPGPTAAAPARGLPPWSRLAVDASGLRLLVGQQGGRVAGWDLSRLRRLHGFISDSPATAVLWSRSGPITGHVDGSIARWHADGRLVARTPAHAPGQTFASAGEQQPTGGIDGLFELPDGTWVSTGRASVRRWRGGTPLATHPLPTPSLQFTAPVVDGAHRLVISTIRGLVRVDPRDGRIEALDPPAGGIAGAPYFRVAAGGPYVAGVRHGADGQRLSIWRGAGAPIVDRALPAGHVVQALAFAPAGRRLAVIAARTHPGGSPDAGFPIYLIDPPTGALTGTIEEHRAAVSTARFEPEPPPDLDRLLTGGYDGHRRVFEVDDAGARLTERAPGCPPLALAAGPSAVALCPDQLRVERDGGRLTLLDHPDGTWLIAADDGHFAASAEGDRLAVAVTGPRVVGLDRIALSANRPDAIARRFGLGDPELRADLERRVDRRRQKHGLGTAEATAVSAPRVDLAPIATAADDGIVRGGARSAAGLDRWRLRVDGTVVAGGPLDGATARFEARIPLTDGLNRVEVDVADRDGRWSPRAVADVAHDDPRPTRLHVFAFGVSRYADPAIRDLRFAHRDALALVARLKRAPGFAAVVARAYTDEAVVAGAFDEAAALLADADPRDTVVIFVSGHGLYDRGGTYRYLTHETRLARVEEGLAFDRIEALLDATPARRRLMLLDTCQSGELFDDEAITAPAPGGAGEMRARVLPGASRLIRPIAAAPPTAPADRRDRFVDRDLRRGRGAVVFASSRGSEASWELDALGHGAFTWAVLEALAGAADPDGDGRIALDALRDHVAAEVARLTGGRQHPTVDRENRAARITLPTIPAEAR